MLLLGSFNTGSGFHTIFTLAPTRTVWRTVPNVDKSPGCHSLLFACCWLEHLLSSFVGAYPCVTIATVAYLFSSSCGHSYAVCVLPFIFVLGPVSSIRVPNTSKRRPQDTALRVGLGAEFCILHLQSLAVRKENSWSNVKSKSNSVSMA